MIVPVYYEGTTVGLLLDADSTAPYRKQIVVVVDGIRDGTAGMMAGCVASAPASADVVLLRTTQTAASARRSGPAWRGPAARSS